MQEKKDLSFRKISLFDAQTFATWRKDKELGWQVGWAIDPKKWNLNTEKEWIMNSNSDRHSNFWACLLGGEVIGRVGIYNIDFKDSSGEISILIGAKSARGHGVGQEMLDFVLEKGYNELALNKMYATIFEDNLGAIRFFERNNFKKSGSTGKMNFLGTNRIFTYFDHIRSS